MYQDIEEGYDKLLAELRMLLESEDFLERHRRQEGDFSRRRRLSFVMVILTLINLLKRALQDELDELFRLFSEAEVAERCVTKSGFSQVRQKLKHTAFIELNQTQVQHFSTSFEHERWQGHRLLASDGSLIDVPNHAAHRAEFGSWGSRHETETAKARISQLFDVLNGISVDGILAPKTVGERQLAQQHLQQVQPGALLLLDRGYPAFWLFLAIMAAGAHFCARLELNKWRVAQAFGASGAATQVVTVPLWASSRALCREHGFDCAAVTLRLVRVDLPTGEVEVLATSLFDLQLYPTCCFAELYQQRWPVEEDYKQFKSRLQLENWSGLTAHAVRQDFYATLFTKNLAAILAQPAQQVVATLTATHKYPYQVNFTNLLANLKDTIVLLFSRTDPRPYLFALWQQMLQTIEPIRKGRSKLSKSSPHRHRFPTAYKPTR